MRKDDKACKPDVAQHQSGERLTAAVRRKLQVCPRHNRGWLFTLYAFSMSALPRLWRFIVVGNG